MLRVMRSEGLTVLTVVLLKMLGKWFMTCAFAVRVIQSNMCSVGVVVGYRWPGRVASL